MQARIYHNVFAFFKSRSHLKEGIDGTTQSAEPAVGETEITTVFNTPLDRITYDEVMQFCASYTEGVRVEYKREPVNIPKVISSFANTVGGIWVIGVDADKKTNRAVLPPIGSDATGLEERIVQSAQQGIYPAIAPAMRVFSVPDRADRVIAVVKVGESVDAPHAIENSTRVWVRTASTTEPYDLADIDRIDYLLKRRREPEQRREELIKRASSRSFYVHESRSRITACPVYPRGVLWPLTELYDRAVDYEKRGVYYLRDVRTVHQAIASSGRPGSRDHYFELSVHGVALFDIPLQIAGVVAGVRFVRLGELLYPLGHALNTAIRFLGQTTTNLLIRYELIGLAGIAFSHVPNLRALMDGEYVAQQQCCVDPSVSVETIAISETVLQNRVDILTDLIRQVLWAFNYRSDELLANVYQSAQTLKII